MAARKHLPIDRESRARRVPARHAHDGGTDEPRNRALGGLHTLNLMRSTALLLALTSTHAALELTPSNFDKEVFDSGKSAFIKFLAPW